MKVLFFAQLRDVLKCTEMSLEGQWDTVAGLRGHLQSKGPDWQDMLAPGRALVAVNQTLVDDNHALNSNDEVAFFPPVTGG